MAELEKVIKGLECQYEPRMTCNGCDYFIARDKLCNKNKIFREAVDLLKAQEPRVMTLEEIEDALDNVVWLDIPGAENLADGFSLIMAYSRKNGFVLLDSPFGDNPSQDRFEYTDYNKTWRCWTSRPTDSERGNTPWEDCPICSEAQREDEAASEMRDYCERYEPTYNPDDGSM